jgi:AmmeMemoRadiSam system protein A
MAHTLLSNEFNEEERKILLDWAKASIEYGLETGRPISPDLSQFPEKFSERRATFVTLEKHKQLRGCIGTLEAIRPLLEDITQNAFAAAFNDPRFLPVQRNELDDLAIHISVLSPAKPMTFTSEQDLITQLHPGIDGLIIEDKGRRGTFLPSVWESLPKPEDFLSHLKLKAGLPENYWSNTIKIYRYTTEMID